MKNRELAEIFDRMADVIELQGGNPFRVRSYRKASRIIGDLTDDIADIAREGRLGELPGIGESFVQKIQEYLDTGRLAAHDELVAQVPPGVLEMMHVPGLGPKTAGLVYKKAGIESIDQLAEAIEAGKLADLPGLGAKKLQNILKGIQVYRSGQGRVLLGVALPIAEEIIEHLKKVKGVRDILPAGSLRRCRETIGDVDILVSSTKGKDIVEAFTRLPMVRDVLAAGETKGSVRVEGGLQVDLRVVPPKSFGAAAQYFTGSKAHNIRLRDIAIDKKLKLNEYGVFRGDRQIAGKSEEEVYGALDLPWIPPELREDRGEVEAAQEGRLPELIEPADIRGDLHMHSTHSDGNASIEAMALAAREVGYEYICITDHSQSLKVAHGLDPKRLEKQRKEIDALNKKLDGIRILAGIELDILADGSLDLPDEALAACDFVIASIHSGMQQDEKRLTARLVKAMRNPHVHAIAHPTGRVLGGQRDAYPLDFDEIVRVAKQTGTALEINAYYDRLDLDDLHARRARDAGVKLVINTDAHATTHLAMMRFGVATARRGWVRKADVLNTLPLEKLLSWLAEKRND